MGSPSQVSIGALTPFDTYGHYNNILFAITQAISRLQTVTLVQVQSCSNSGGLSPVGTVNVIPLVNQIDGSGNATPHGTLFNLPYLRMQGGQNAVILDPQVGDIGIALFASRDISKVISTKAQANPGSFRQFDFSDGLYLGGVLNAIPNQYVQFSSSGISLVSPNAVTISAPTINLDAGDTTMSLGSNGLTVTSSGVIVNASEDVSVTATGDVSIMGADVSITPLAGGGF